MGFFIYKSMEHVDWLDPDNIILANFSSNKQYKDFTSDMRSGKFSQLRMLSYDKRIFIRYLINNLPIWYECSILQRKGKDYYITIYSPAELEGDVFLEKKYVKFDREYKLNQILK